MGSVTRLFWSVMLEISQSQEWNWNFRVQIVMNKSVMSKISKFQDI